MNEQAANALAPALGGEASQRGGGVWIPVLLRLLGSRFTVISGDAISDCASQAAFDDSAASNTIVLV